MVIKHDRRFSLRWKESDLWFQRGCGGIRETNRCIGLGKEMYDLFDDYS